MYLRSLKMQGFKSFPDQTVIEFHPGVTAIVGPNGSGKSNVTDAIRWVLGEQSARLLRGSRMEDMVFSGTETRRQLGYSEVTITFDNRDHVLPIEFDTVEVTRRYYRSGESDYLINQVSCRLKDIVGLFLDTGIGRDGYSIIGQGKVDEILSNRSEDRRRVFDEAAGITKYKMRKLEAERKLERTEQNLLRIDDIIRELEQRITPLRKQAEKARLFQTLSDSQRELDLNLTVYDIRQNEAQAANFQQSEATLNEDLERVKVQAQDLRDAHRESGLQLEEMDLGLEQSRQRHGVISSQISQVGEEQASIRENKRFLQTQSERQQAEIADIRTQMAALSSDLLERERKRENLEQVLQRYRRDLDEQQAAYETLANDLSQAEATSDQFKNKLDDIREKIFQAKSNHDSTEYEINLTKQQLEKNAFDSAELDARLTRAQFRLEEATQLIRDERIRLQDALAELTETREQVAGQKNLCEQSDRRQHELNAEFNNLQYRLRTLRELEQAREGYHYAVRTIMKKAEDDAVFGEGIHGPLGELIRVPREFERAIEVTLGGTVNHIVTDERKTAARLIEWLKETRSGRETFLPLDVMRGQELAKQDLAKISHVSGFLGVASQLIDFAPQYQGVVNSILGRVLIVENLDRAMEIARELRYRHRVVTLEGDIIQTGGSMTGGQSKRGESIGLFSRANEIEELEQRIVKIQSEIEDGEQTLNEQTQHLVEVAERQAALEKKHRETEQHLYELTSGQQQAEKDVESLRKQILEKSKEAIQWQTEEANLRQLCDQLAGDKVRYSAEETALQKQIEQLSSGNQAKSSQRDDLREQIADLRVSVHSIEETLNNMSELSRRVDEERAGREKRIARLESEIEQAGQEIQRLTLAENQLSEKRKNLDAASNGLEAEVAVLQEQRQTVIREQQRLFREIEESGQLISRLQLECERATQKRLRVDQVIVELKNRIWETYETTFIDAGKSYQQPENISAARKTLKEIRQQIRDLGPVNPAAAEEFAEVSERHEFMREQHDDIAKAKAQLVTVIAELDEAMRQQFNEHFVKINEHFKQVFSELFVGGKAELELESEDVLSCGIEIKAQPPGKRLQNLTLLSGGERSLTAIALLFAIFKLRPSPFCVLDEVESALDDANVIRFTDYIRNYTDNSQFILVTHRKGTMEAADRLYGVTMKERGVSKILSLALTDD